MTSKKNIAIIGAGFGGLSAAYDLAQAGNTVTIFEAADHPGGLASGFKEPHWDWSVENFYHHVFQSDKHILGLIDELGWSEKVIFPRPVTVMYYKGKFYPFDSIPNALLYPGLGWGINKIRFGLVGVYLRLTNNWQNLEKTTVDAWMRKWAGTKVYESMWEPMIVGKFGEEYAKVVNMAWMWARLHARTTRLGTFEGGFQNFANLFAERLQQMGVTIHFNTRIVAITTTEQGQLAVKTAAETQHFDQVLSTTSPALLAKLAPELPEDYLQGLLSLKSMGAVVMVFALKHSLSKEGYYWYNIPKVQASHSFPLWNTPTMYQRNILAEITSSTSETISPRTTNTSIWTKKPSWRNSCHTLKSSILISHRIGSGRPGYSGRAMLNRFPWSTTLKTSLRFRRPSPASISPA